MTMLKDAYEKVLEELSDTEKFWLKKQIDAFWNDPEGYEYSDNYRIARKGNSVEEANYALASLRFQLRALNIRELSCSLFFVSLNHSVSLRGI